MIYMLIWNTLIAAVFTLFDLVFDPRDSFAHVAATTRDLTGRAKVKLKGRPETLVVSRAYAHRFRQM